MSTDFFWVKVGLAIVVVVAAIEVAARLSGVRLRWLRIGAVSAITGSLVAGAVLVATTRGWASRDAIMAVFSASLAIVLSVIWFLTGERPRRRAEPCAPPNGGPGMRPGNSDIGGGPPSVS